uniref:Protein kinase domain-containing protein n=1 Tax=Panagrolaimus sp. JU765 TaxID=591449 RepID=A0AC34R7X5_9BILA
MADPPGDDDIGIKPGGIVQSGKLNWVVDTLLGEGGFGAVYKVHEEKEREKEYAMKVEKKLEKRKHSKLKMEVAILKEMNSKPESAKHFTQIVDRGKKEKYFFIVMTLVGKSLDDLKRERPSKTFSLGTAIGSSIQCLEAVQSMHKYGYIHRDLKPANYACGLGKQIRVIFLLDFGIARRVLNDENELKTPRATVGFKGTVRFASLSCHHGKELGAQDDCESWFYLLIDLSSFQSLLWRKLADKNEVAKSKEELRTELGLKKFCLDLPMVKNEFIRVMCYIDRCQYYDKVDYNYIYDILKIAAENAGIKLSDPYDWESDAPVEAAVSKRAPKSVMMKSR